MRWLFFLVFFSSFVLAQPIEYCNGCPYEDRCISFTSQIRFSDGLLYCDQDSYLYPAKSDAMPCSENYECISFLCSAGACQPTDIPILEINSSSSMLLPSIIFGCIFFFALLFFLVKYSLKPKVTTKVTTTKKSAKSFSKSQTNVTPSTIKIFPVKKKYSQFEKLDKQLEESTKKVTQRR